MPKYRLHPFMAKTDRDDLTLEIEGNRARVYRDEKLYHDWGYIECVDYVLPPGSYPGPQGSRAGFEDLSRYHPDIQNDYSFVILIGSRLHQFQMSENAEEAFRRFWEKGYLLRNPNAASASVKAGYCAIAAGGAIMLAALAVTAVTLWLTEGTGAIFLSGIGLFGVGLAFYGWKSLKKRTVWDRVKEELLDEGIEVPDPLTNAPYPTPKIEYVLNEFNRR